MRLILLGLLLIAPAAQSASDISAQGLLRSPPLLRISPRGTARMEIRPCGGRGPSFLADLTIQAERGSIHRLEQVRGTEFLISDVGRIVVIDGPGTGSVPDRLTVLDMQGEALWSARVRHLSGPLLSSDGERLAYRSHRGIELLDLRRLELEQHPAGDLFAAGPAGSLAIARRSPPFLLTRIEPDGRRLRCELPRSPRRLAWWNRDLLVLTRDALWRLSPGASLPQLLLGGRAGEDLRDLCIHAGTIELGARRIEEDRWRGIHIRLEPGTWRPERLEGPWEAIRVAPLQTEGSRSIPWPLQPNAQHPVGNTYGEYQDYGGNPYLHPGVDVMGSGHEPVYAVEPGVVKAVLTTSGEWHWRVAVGETSGSGLETGYLYAHLDETSITVDVGDTVTAGQHLGDLVPWPIYGFTHIHFARIEQSGAVWDGNWLCNGNPHLEIEPQTETEPPVFEPALGTHLLAFCRNESSTYLDPNALDGAVDIVAHVGDRAASTWVCTVQELRYSIFPEGDPQHPVVPDRRSVDFDMDLDTYQGGPVDPFLVSLLYQQDATCSTQGDYDFREFYHILTNSNGDDVYEPADLQEAWDTTLVPDGRYVIRVTARDVAGGETIESMTVTTVNGNVWTPTPVLDTPTPTPGFTVSPTPEASPSPEPTPVLGVRLDLPRWANPGGLFWVTGYVDNPGPPQAAAPLFFILEVEAELWFWPSWSYYAPPEEQEIDYRHVHVLQGTTPIVVVPGFTWPDTGDETRAGLWFYGALLNPEMTAIQGRMAAVEWGYGPLP